MDEISVSFEVKINIKDYQDFCNQIFFKLNKKIIIIAIICIIYLPIPILNIIIGNKEMPISIFFVVLAIPLWVFVGFPKFIKYKLNKTMLKDEFTKKVQRYKISEDNISISSSSGETLIDWNELYKVVELKSCFAIYLSKIQIFVIPMRVFEDKLQIAVLRRILHNKLPAEKLNR
jgi:hypothetical protein